uniref:ATP-grasp domain-containing protein n=1 Tax=Kalanchoe fedtschenkoi TaxID=63787 RepID=A0A7N0TXP1_KALFE
MAFLFRASSLSYNSTQFQLRRRTIGKFPSSVWPYPPSHLVSRAQLYSGGLTSSRCIVPRAASHEVVVHDRAAEEDVHKQRKVQLRVGVICGGPSAERGISLNSARSLIDHIQGDDLLVSCYYIDTDLNAYAISTAQVYSNTPSDFDFKLESLAQVFLSLSDFAEHLATSVDIVFPVIHGQFGEDGGIQGLLEKFNVPFVGTGSNECRQAFDKYEASLELSRQGFMTVPNFLVQEDESNEAELSNWFSKNQLDINTGKVVVKPTRAGSSIGVTVAYGYVDSLRKAKEIISEGIDDKVLIELFLEGGSEFTAIILDVGSAGKCQPVALLPTEVELRSLGSMDVNEKDAIFNYRRKYLPTQQVAYHTPPRFPLDVIESIRDGASLLFKSLGLRDFARIDGWFLPSAVNVSAYSGNRIGRSKYGTVLFTDINLISGMEQTSFLFQQASKVGFSHSNILRSIIHHACSRYRNITMCDTTSSLLKGSKSSELTKGNDAKKVFVIFGGDTSERQVLVIEVNTVPGMTPSTVLIHQALAENPPMYPHKFFRTLLDLGSERFD